MRRWATHSCAALLRGLCLGEWFLQLASQKLRKLAGRSIFTVCPPRLIGRALWGMAQWLWNQWAAARQLCLQAWTELGLVPATWMGRWASLSSLLPPVLGAHWLQGILRFLANRFTGKGADLAFALFSCLQGGEQLIAAFHSPSGASSFTSAVSSLPSLTAQVGACVTPRAVQQHSLSPIAGQSSSHHGAAAGRVSAVRMGRSAGGLGGSRMRRSKVVSTPGDTGSGAAAAAALQDDSCSAEEEAAATVQRTAASWSHSAGGKGKDRSPPASSTQEKLMASAARLGMYRQMLKGGGRIGRGRAP